MLVLLLLRAQEQQQPSTTSSYEALKAKLFEPLYPGAQLLLEQVSGRVQKGRGTLGAHVAVAGRCALQRHAVVCYITAM